MTRAKPLLLDQIQSHGVPTPTPLWPKATFEFFSSTNFPGRHSKARRTHKSSKRPSARKTTVWVPSVRTIIGTIVMLVNPLLPLAIAELYWSGVQGSHTAGVVRTCEGLRVLNLPQRDIVIGSCRGPSPNGPSCRLGLCACRVSAVGSASDAQLQPNTRKAEYLSDTPLSTK
jgi:hypothetical protein